MEIRSKRLKGLRHTAKHLLSPHLGFESGRRFGATANWVYRRDAKRVSPHGQSADELLRDPQYGSRDLEVAALL